jgi:hypothetical protein
MDGEVGIWKTHLYHHPKYKKAKIERILASKSMVEAGEG